MHAGVRMPARALVDDAFALLARLLELADADHARGKFARLVDACTLTQHYTLSELRVVVVLGDRGPDALLRAGLATLAPFHEPTPIGEEIGVQPTPVAAGERLLRLEYTRKYIEWYGSILKGASRGGNGRVRKLAEARAKAVDNVVEKLSDSPDRAAAVVHSGVPQGNPPGWPPGNPQGQPLLTRASEISERSDLREIPEGDVHRKPPRSATPGLRLINGGADDAAEGGS
jgi:hypothetical protein